MAAVSKFNVALFVYVEMAAAAHGKGDAAGVSVRTPDMVVMRKEARVQNLQRLHEMTLESWPSRSIEIWM